MDVVNVDVFRALNRKRGAQFLIREIGNLWYSTHSMRISCLSGVVGMVGMVIVPTAEQTRSDAQMTAYRAWR